MNFTVDQQKAIDIKNKQVLLSAAAGSGKTAVLIEHIHKLLIEEDITLANLLVLTFTDKAAKEMRQRLIARLNKSIESETNEALANKLTEQISLINFSNISTIHSFCRKLIKQNFHAVGIDPTFKLSDEENTSLLKSESLLEVLEQKYEDGNPEFLKVVENFSGKVMDDALMDTLLKLYNYSMSNPFPMRWLKEVSDLYENIDNSIILDFLTNYAIEEYESALVLINALIEDLAGLDDFVEHLSGCVFQKEAIESIINIIKADITNAYKVVESFENKKLKSSRKKEIDKDFQKKIIEKYNNIYDIRENIDSVFFYKPFEELTNEIKSQGPIVLEIIDILEKFNDTFSKKKREKNLLDYNDLEHYAIKILVDENGNPTKIANEYQNQFFEIMVDEFQDTNLVQETILNSMLKESPNKYMVGDVKQSIYRFRKANPKIFIDNYNNFLTKSDDHNQLINLSSNFRSRKGIIDGTNYIFKTLMTKDFGGIDYDENVQLYCGRSQLSFENDRITFMLINKAKKEASDETEGTEEVVENKPTLTKHEIEAKAVAKEIFELVNAEPPLLIEDDKELRKIDYNDITILLRSFSHVDEYIDALNELKISAIALNKTDYFYEIEVKTVLSVLAVIDNKLLDIPLTAILSSEIYDISPEELLDIKQDFQMSLYENIEIYINENDNNVTLKLNKFISDLKKWKEIASKNSITELLWSVFNETNYIDIISVSSKGEKAVMNLMVLLERAKEYEQTNRTGLHNFLKYIESCSKSKMKVDGGASDTDPSSVNIMTIHKSKGLEFKVVFLCSQGSSFNTSDETSNMVIDDDLGFGFKYFNEDLRVVYDTIYRKAIAQKQKISRLEEETRLLYVALTRATEKLYICGYPSVSSEKKIIYNDICNGATNFTRYFKNASNYFDFILPTVIKHSSFKNFRELIDIEQSFDEDNALFDVKIIDENSIIDDVSGVNFAENKISDFLLNIDIADIGKGEKTERVPLNITISELKQQMFGSKFERIYKKPNFAKANVNIFTPAEKGTILHKFLENINFSENYDETKLFELMDSLVVKGIITKEETKTLKIKNINKFINSELFDRIKNSDKIYTEKAFATYIDRNKFSNTLDTQSKYIVHGIIDLYFIKDDQIILVDYKTDYINDSNQEELIESFQLQLSVYKEAIEKAENLKVTEAYVYSFSKGESLKIL